MNLRFLSVTSAAIFSATAQASAASITVAYSGYGHNGGASQPAVGTSFNTGNVDSSGNFMVTHTGNVSTSDSLATAARAATLTDTGDGSALFTSSSNYQSVSTVNDPAYSSNKQIDGGGYRYVGFTVDTPGPYVFTFQLQAGNRVSNPGSNGQYSYYGMGGSGNVEVNNFPAANTLLYSTGNTGNLGDPAPNTTGASYTTTLNLDAGVQYQLNYNSYMYSGFGGTGTIEHNSGWNVTIAPAPIPEPATALLSLGLATSFLFRRRRD
jgi:hypothetical protein